MDKFAKRMLESGQTNVSNYLLSNFLEIGMSPDEFMIYLQIKRYSDEGIKFPDIDKITNSTGYSKQQAYQLLHEMIHKKLMTIKTVNHNNKKYDQYDFTLMYEKLASLSNNQSNGQDDYFSDNGEVNETDDSTTVTERNKVFKQIEQEFGRTLSPMELETVSQWLDVNKYKPEMISLALRQAILNQVYNLKYIDRILLNWDRQNIKTPQEVENKQNQYSGKHLNNNQYKKDGPKIPIFKIK